ncbi:MAG: hypothetical protein HOK28_20815, partial [Deltaproteobacteria bacterium]|nr:hypothetical protein [Deltaproteobacteria bacterium]
MNRFFFSSICVLALALGGCGGDDERPSTDPGDTNNGSGDTNPGTDTDTDTTPSEPGRTVANCETNIADDVPAFYEKYFRCVTITMDGDSV